MDKNKIGILIVDDDSDASDDFRGWLTELGRSIDIANCCEAAKELLEKNMYGVAIVDMNMPDFSGEMSENAGEELYDFIRKNNSLTRTIILTNLPSTERAVGMTQKGVPNYISKLETTKEKLQGTVRNELVKFDQALESLRNFPHPPSG
ncbi:MAG: response regulator [Candidatus Zixiibacteriota bacterium]